MGALGKHRKKAEASTEDWMGTFADTITLILAFFVILLSVSEPKQKKFEEVKQGMQQEFSGEAVATPFVDMYKSMEAIVASNNMQRNAAMEETDRGIRLEFDSASFFGSGSADLTKEARKVLDDLAVALRDFTYADYIVEIEGHTDDIPIHSARFPSNWDLSASRSTAVVQYLLEAGMDPQRLKAAAYADTRPKAPNADVYGNAIPENQALNRRIVVNLERAEE
ncbi:MAG: flagellar motor protein MotB [Alphaproteobacteria bacterium]|nr:flagellar motor protein MotB [Alphaproteobacteria bacterium]